MCSVAPPFELLIYKWTFVPIPTFPRHRFGHATPRMHLSQTRSLPSAHRDSLKKKAVKKKISTAFKHPIVKPGTVLVWHRFGMAPFWYL